MASVVPAELAPIFQIFKGITADANALAATIKAAKSDKSEAVNTVLDSSDDPRIVEFREKYAKGQAQIAEAQARLESLREAAKVHAISLLPGSDPNFNVEESTKEFLEKRKDATQMRKTLERLLGNNEEALKAAFEEFGIVEVVSLGRNSTGANAKGSGEIKRPRITAATVDGETVADSKGKVSFTVLANNLGVDGDQLRKAAFAAAGTDDLSTLDPGTVITFPITKGEKVHTVTVTAKGKPVAEESASGEETSATE